MTQKQIYDLLVEVGGKATVGELSIKAGQKYPNDPLVRNIGLYLRGLAKWGYVAKKGHYWEITDVPYGKDSPALDIGKDITVVQKNKVVNDEDGKELWSAYFFEKERIKPVVLDTNDLDVVSPFLVNLKMSLKAGYDKSRPIRIATNAENPEVDGQLIDGLHRSYIIDIVYKHEDKEIKPEIVREYIKDLDTLRAKKLHYEFLNQSKSVYISNVKAEKSFAQTLREHPELTTLEGILAFFAERGFVNKGAIEHMYKRFATIQENIKKRNERIKKIVATQDERKTPVRRELVNNFVTEDEGTTTRIACPCCKEEFVGYIKNNSLVRVEKIQPMPA